MVEILGIKLHLYGLLIGLGTWLAFEVALKQAKNHKDKALLVAAFPWLILGGVIGARAYHVVDFWSRYYVLNPWKVWFVWEGGLGIWGGIGGVLIGGLGYCRWKRVNFLSMMDKLAIGGPLAQAIGRLGNWVNGELYGKKGEPLFAYEAGLNLILFGFLWWMAKKKTKVGRLTGLYLLGYGVIRVVLEGLRPADVVWKVGAAPVAVVWGVVAIASGAWLVFQKRS